MLIRASPALWNVFFMYSSCSQKGPLATSFQINRLSPFRVQKRSSCAAVGAGPSQRLGRHVLIVSVLRLSRG